MTSKSKLMIGSLLFFIGLATVVYFYQSSGCDSERKTIDEYKACIANRGSIARIQLYKSYRDFKVNLVKDTFEITNEYDIELIRKMINGVNSGTWNHPIASWNVTMRFILSNGQPFDLRVSKINNDKSPDMTHVSFGSGQCGESSPRYSETWATTSKV